MLSRPLDRSKRPEIRRIEQITLAPAEKITFDNGLPAYIINQGSQDICNIEINFGAGKWVQPKKLVARFTNRMLREGTASYSAAELSAKLDFFGASVKTQSGTDRALVNLVALNKHLPEILPILAEILMQPAFSPADLQVVLTSSREKLKVSRSKHDFVAERKLMAVLFGEEHPYGYAQEDADYDNISKDDLRQFYNTFYTSQNCFMVVSGKISGEAVGLLREYFGTPDFNKTTVPLFEKSASPSATFQHRQEMPHSVQSAIRIGKLLFNKTHPHFLKMQVVSTLLGGYFGSRLMSNIREDKGYTYGIHSGLTSLVHGGHFYISTEVGLEVTDDALKEIYFEIDRLKSELVPQDELDLVKNYLTGKILAGLDGPFRLASHYSNLLIYGLDIDYFYRMMEAVKSITPQEIRDLAIKYLDTKDLYEVVVG